MDVPADPGIAAVPAPTRIVADRVPGSPSGPTAALSPPAAADGTSAPAGPGPGSGSVSVSVSVSVVQPSRLLARQEPAVVHDQSSPVPTGSGPPKPGDDPALATPSPAAASFVPTMAPPVAGPDVPHPASPTAHAPPAAQVAAALGTMPASMDFAGPLASPRILSVQIDPEELGRVRIRIDQGADGPARVDLTAERPETLQLLMRDQPALHRALDAAGVTPDARVIRFHLADLGANAPALPAPPLPQPPLQPPPQPAAGFMNGFSQGGQAGGNGQPAPQPAPQAIQVPSFASNSTTPQPFPAPRAGARTRIDITA